MSEQNTNKRPEQRRKGPPMGGGFGMPVEKAKNFKVSLKRLIGYLKPHRVNLIIVLIFAIASTAFSVYSPKLMSRATNKLQDAYMARTMLKNVSDGQKKAVDEISKAMSEAQTKSVEQISVQMADVQKKMTAQIGQQMQSPALRPGAHSNPGAQQINPEAMAAIQDFMKLPLIDTISDSKQKNDTIIRMIDLLAKMPKTAQGSQQEQAMDPAALVTMKEILELPAVDKINDPQKKNEVIVKLIDLLSKMTSTQQSGQNSQPDSSKEKIDPKTMEVSKEMLQLPMLDKVKDADQKADICKKLVDLNGKMPSDGQNGSQVQNAGKNMKFTQEQIDGTIKAIRETNGEYDFGYIGMIALILLGMYLVSSLFSLIMGLVMSGVAQKTVRDLRSEVDNKLGRLPLKYYDMHPHGDILSRVTNDIDTIATTLQQSLTQLITAVVTILGYIIMMLTISPILTLIVVATLPMYVITTALIAKKSQKYFASQQKELGLLSGHVEEMYTGHKIVKAFGKEKDSVEKFETVNEKLYRSGWKAQFISGIMFPLMNFISNVGYVAICIVGGIWITKNRLGLGDILAFIQYSRSFTMPIVQTANIANVIQSTVACAERVFNILDEKEEIPDSQDSRTIAMPKGEVLFEHVDFRYVEDVPLINDMNLDVRQGHTIAIVGPTGAGKTTLVNLLMRFYEINSGKISIDGIDVRDMKRSDLRKMFGMVLQDTWLFNGTIKDNIAYGKEDASMDEIVRAAKAAHADHFIRTLPDGYNTVLNEEATNISQGQKQLLTIARAIMANPTVLILDEATSSVDTRTEVLIQKGMANLMKNRTSFVIAHRLSTIRDAELILVMNHGSIIEMGNHKELLEKGGFYADLYNSQFTGANLENQAV